MLKEVDKIINLNEFRDWFQDRLDAKYGQQMQNLKRVFIVFYNLAGQIIDLYFSVLEKVQSYSQDHQLSDNTQYKNATNILSKSLFILNEIADLEKYPICLDSNFCQKFIKLFEENLNLLCTLYHSFAHIQLTNEIDIKFQREKIVEGINKLYSVHLKIKQYSKVHNNILKNIYSAKKIFFQKVTSIQKKLKEFKNKDSTFDNFEAYAIQFYTNLQQSIEKVESSPQAKKNFMKCYFHLLHQLYSTQAKLQIFLEIPLTICQQIKNKKKKVSFGNQDTMSQYTKWVNSLLKQGSSMKNIKKIKVDDFIKYTVNLLKQKDPLLQSIYLPNIQQIQQSLNLIIQITKQCEKIEQSDLINMINQYKKSLLPNNLQKMLSKLVDYQHYMAKYYQLHEQVKDLNKLVQFIVLKELGLKINVKVDYQI